MISVEMLNNKNIEYFNLLLHEVEEKYRYRTNFYKYYNSKSFMYKYFIRKLVRLIKFNNEYIGYIWIESFTSKSVRVADIYIKDRYIEYVNEKFPIIFKSDLVVFESFEDTNILSIVKQFKMTRIRLTKLMMMDTHISYKNTKFRAEFDMFRKNKDEKRRRDIQNLIFNEDSRVPLSTQDIFFDEKQDYYVDDLCVFIKVDNKTIGYGQVIYNREVFMIVNFGIIEEYRSKGYGRELIIKLIELSNEKGIDNLYIRVDDNNILAKKLYTSVGFNEVGNFTTWLWSKKLINL